jgi:triacylglycerol lipase/cholesterol oxidase
MALASGKIQGIASITCNSVSLTPKVHFVALLKALVAPGLLENILGYPYLSPKMPYMPGTPFGKWMYWLEALVHHECQEPSCHMLSFLWGWGFPAVYCHENINPVTHRRLPDLFGGTSFNYHRHIRKMIFSGSAIPYSQEGIYSALPNNYLENTKNIQLPPILLLSGSKNNIFPNSNKTTYKKLQSINPKTNVQFIEIANYGHQDIYIGDRAYLDCFPHIIEHLNKYSEPL